MAKCIRCKKEMRDRSTTTCKGYNIVNFPDGTIMSPIQFLPSDKKIRCHDCNVSAGGCHHVGCDMEICPRCGGQLLGCSCFVGSCVNDEKMEYDLLSAANEIYELGMKICSETEDVPYAAFFFSPNAEYCEDKFNFTNKTEAMMFIQEMIAYYQAKIVVLMSKLTGCEIGKLPPGFFAKSKDIMCIYAEDKSESYGVIIDYWVGDDGYIEFGDEFELPEGETVGQLTGFLNNNLRLKRISILK